MLRALALGVVVCAGCGRLDFEPPRQANEHDAGAIDAGTVDAGGPRDGGIDAPREAPDGGRDAGNDAGTEPEGCRVVFDGDYTSALPALPEPPVIDGVVDCGLPLQPIPTSSWITEPPGQPLPAEHSAQYAAAWRPGGLYLYVEVRDATRLPADPDMQEWCGDAIELFVDDGAGCAAPPLYDRPGTTQAIVRAPHIASASVTTGSRFDYGRMLVQLDWPTANVRAIATADGYALEAFVRADDLGLATWTLAAGQRLGFNLGVDVSVPASTGNPCTGPEHGHRLGQHFLWTAGPLYPEDTPFYTCAAFVRPMLLP